MGKSSSTRAVSLSLEVARNTKAFHELHPRVWPPVKERGPLSDFRMAAQARRRGLVNAPAPPRQCLVLRGGGEKVNGLSGLPAQHKERAVVDVLREQGVTQCVVVEDHVGVRKNDEPASKLAAGVLDKIPIRRLAVTKACACEWQLEIACCESLKSLEHVTLCSQHSR
jgi:hypothetical protein